MKDIGYKGNICGGVTKGGKKKKNTVWGVGKGKERALWLDLTSLCQMVGKFCFFFVWDQKVKKV